ncbi:MAG: hydroxymethylbilane synthase [Bdellovibrionales bacterium]|nr:hydroxymethylbilane synthase [Bdellovibrionales bacterium]
MRLKIASRQSDLARLQAYRVAEALRRIEPAVQIEFEFRSSFGDRNLDVAMDGAVEKGLFTQDFYEGLVGGEFDLVVHSWKDLPTEARPGTQVVATLPRADVRDLLLVRKDARSRAQWRVLSSSPRRSYNLQQSLKTLLPGQPEIQFVPVRGNIPTRLRKLLTEPAEALIVAKAALDRLLEAPEAEFASVKTEIRRALAACDWMALPLTLNPTAAAQGALAIEIAEGRSDLQALLGRVNCRETFAAAQRERAILSSFGGGCHQKIGVNFLRREYGGVLFLQGLTDTGVKLHKFQLEREGLGKNWQAHRDQMFPVPPNAIRWYGRRELEVGPPPRAQGLWVARAEAFPPAWENQDFAAIWTSGLKSWRGLAARGVWVNGCAESLGEQEAPMIETLCGKRVDWLKLTHAEGFDDGRMTVLATYALEPEAENPVLRGKTHFYWMSASSFWRARELFPEMIAQGYHACGPGNTWRLLQNQVAAEKLQVFLSYEDWYRTLTEGDQTHG